jgi:hypothetical protein
MIELLLSVVFALSVGGSANIATPDVQVYEDGSYVVHTYGHGEPVATGCLPHSLCKRN